MPKFLEKKLKKEYGVKSAIPFKIMNKIGAMKGNKETAKGKAMERKHMTAEQVTKRKRTKLSNAADKMFSRRSSN